MNSSNHHGKLRFGTAGDSHVAGPFKFCEVRFINATSVYPEVLNAIETGPRRAKLKFAKASFILCGVVLDVGKNDFVFVHVPGVGKNSIGRGIFHKILGEAEATVRHHLQQAHCVDQRYPRRGPKLLWQRVLSTGTTALQSKSSPVLMRHQDRQPGAILIHRVWQNIPPVFSPLVYNCRPLVVLIDFRLLKHVSPSGNGLLAAENRSRRQNDH